MDKEFLSLLIFTVILGIVCYFVERYGQPLEIKRNNLIDCDKREEPGFLDLKTGKRVEIDPVTRKERFV